MDLSKSALRMNLRATNSITKYPSILTYHALGDRGRLKPEVLVPFEQGPIIGTEKIDGTNARIIVLGEDYMIGQREELLFARGDCIHNPSMGIVDAIRSTADRLVERLPDGETPLRNDVIHVFFGEVYGGNIGAASKTYTRERATGFRVFDMVRIGIVDFAVMSTWPTEHIARWRDHGNQRFLDWETTHAMCDVLGLSVVPILQTFNRLPTGLAETLEWMNGFLSVTKAGFDAHGRPEGIVVRTPDRTKIAKIRFEDYERTLRK